MLFTPPASSGLVLLSTVVAANSATVDLEVTLDGTYEEYLVAITEARPVAAAGDLRARLKIAGAYDAGANYLFHAGSLTSAAAAYGASVAAVGAPQTFLSLSTGSAMSSGAGRSLSADLRISNPAGALAKKMWGQGVSINGAGELAALSCYGSNVTAGAVTGIRLYDWAGNIASGTFRLYGVKR